MNSICISLSLIVAVGLSADSTKEITVRIGSGTIEIAKDQIEAELFRDTGTRGGGILFTCKELRLQRDASTYSVNCSDVKFITAAGVEGIAPEAQFDLLGNRVLLAGSKDRPVQIIRDAKTESEMTRMTAVHVEMRLTPLIDTDLRSDTNEPSHAPEPANVPPPSSVPTLPAR